MLTAMKSIRKYLRQRIIPVRRKPGPPVLETFESAVWCKLIETTCITDAEDGNRTSSYVTNSIVYNYGVLRLAMRETTQLREFANDERVGKLTFSNGYIKNFLRRYGFTRRRISNEAKEPPSDGAINAHMRSRYEKLVAGKWRMDEVANFDETAFNYQAGSLYLFCPVDQKRPAGQKNTTVKVRITAVMALNCQHGFYPHFFILRHSKSSFNQPDQTRMTIVSTLHKKEGYTRQDGWELAFHALYLTANDTLNQLISFLLPDVTLTSLCVWCNYI